VARFDKKKAKKTKSIKIEKEKIITLLIVSSFKETDYSLSNNSGFIALTLFAKLLFKLKTLLSKKRLRQDPFISIMLMPDKVRLILDYCKKEIPSKKYKYY
jgi:hypothetical protein